MYNSFNTNNFSSPYQTPYDFKPAFMRQSQTINPNQIQSNQIFQTQSQQVPTPLSVNYGTYFTPQQVRYEQNYEAPTNPMLNGQQQRKERRNITENNLYRSQIIKSTNKPELLDLNKQFQERKSEKVTKFQEQPAGFSRFKSVDATAKNFNQAGSPSIKPIEGVKFVQEQIISKPEEKLDLEKILQYENTIFKLKKQNIELNQQNEQYKMLNESVMKDYTSLKGQQKGQEDDQTAQQELLCELSNTNKQLQNIIKNQSEEIENQNQKYTELEKKMKEMLNTQEEMELLATKKINIFENQLELYLQQNEELTQQLEYYKQLAISQKKE